MILCLNLFPLLRIITLPPSRSSSEPSKCSSAKNVTPHPTSQRDFLLSGDYHKCTLALFGCLPRSWNPTSASHGDLSNTNPTNETTEHWELARVSWDCSATTWGVTVAGLRAQWSELFRSPVIVAFGFNNAAWITKAPCFWLQQQTLSSSLELAQVLLLWWVCSGDILCLKV